MVHAVGISSARGGLAKLASFANRLSNTSPKAAAVCRSARHTAQEGGGPCEAADDSQGSHRKKPSGFKPSFLDAVESARIVALDEVLEGKGLGPHAPLD